MKQPIEQDHQSDADGNPTGGYTSGVGMAIRWQHGPLGRGPTRQEPNGAFVEGVIQAAIGRLEFYQDSRFRCQANADALHALYEALKHLEARTAEREQRDVEGTHTP